jgi:hypothetical protein
MTRGRLLLAVAMADLMVLIGAAGAAVHRSDSARPSAPTANGAVPFQSKAPGGPVATATSGHGAEPASSGLPAVAPAAAVLAADGPSVPGLPPASTGDATRYDHVTGLAAKNGVMVAVGERLSSDKDPNPRVSEPRVWWSTDAGASWTPAIVPGWGTLAAVVADRDRFIATGTRVRPEGFSSLVLTSADGRTWREEAVQHPGVVLLTAVASPAGPILAGATVRQEGNRPFVLVPNAAASWSPVRPDAGLNGSGAELRAVCADERTLIAVGTASDTPGRDRPYVIQSSDWGVTWNAVSFPGAPAIGRDATANGCAFAGGRLAVVGRATTSQNANRGYVSIREAGAWRETRALAPSVDTPVTHTLVRTVTAAGSEFVIGGYDTTEDGGGDPAFWVGGRTDGPFARLPALEEQGAQRGPADVRAVIFDAGLLVAAGTSAHRAVVWRSSLDLAHGPPTAKPALDTGALPPWRLVSFDTCTLLDTQSLTAVRGEAPSRSERRSHEYNSTCVWYIPNGALFILEISPAVGFDLVRATYSSSYAPPETITGLCDAAAYFPTTLTVAARCGDTAIVLRSVSRESGTALVRQAAGRIPPVAAARN